MVRARVTSGEAVRERLIDLEYLEAARTQVSGSKAAAA
jgi:hypothetical protein